MLEALLLYRHEQQFSAAKGLSVTSVVFTDYSGFLHQ
jgi:hypothetical protein